MKKYKYIAIILIFISNLAFSETIKEKHDNLDLSVPTLSDKSKFRIFPDQVEHKIIQFGIQRTACFGTCPAYEFIINIDGTIFYEGYAYVEREGSHTGMLPLWSYRGLLELIFESEYASFQDVYEIGILDSPTVYSMVKFEDGTEKVIENYANSGPIELWAIEVLIDNLLEHVEWNE